MYKLNVSTTASIFQTAFHSSLLQKIASGLSIFSLTGLLSGQIIGSRDLMISLQLYNPYIFVFFWATIIIYTMIGGLQAIIQNDIYQVAFIIVVFIGIFLYEVIAYTDVVTTIFTSEYMLPEVQSHTTTSLISIILFPALYAFIEQDVAQQIFSARTYKTAITGTLLTSIFMIFFATIPLYFGIKARFFDVTLPAGANPLLYIINMQYSPLIVAAVVYGIFAAIISTADSLLCAVSSNLIQDFGLDLKQEKRAIFLSKITTVIVGIVALVTSFYFTDILSVLIGSYEIPVVTILIPLLVAYYNYNASKTGAYLSIIFGIGIFLAPYRLQGIEILALIGSAIGYIIGYAIDRMNKNLILSSDQNQKHTA
jgi:SSS family solute:Na+ symporter